MEQCLGFEAHVTQEGSDRSTELPADDAEPQTESSASPFQFETPIKTETSQFLPMDMTTPTTRLAKLKFEDTPSPTSFVKQEIFLGEPLRHLLEDDYYSAEEGDLPATASVSASPLVSAKRPIAKAAKTKAKTKTKAKPKARPKTQSEMVTNADGVVEVAEPKPKPKGRVKKPVPSFKVIDMGVTRLAVDSFMHGQVEGIEKYFLTHFHADHYGGLRKSWQHGPIYCTPITAALCKMKLGVLDEWLVPVPINSPFCVDGVEVVFLDANHCPGAAIILFTSDTKVALHTGDFRANQKMTEEVQRYTDRPIDELYLDTTYLGPSHAFPSQNRVVEVCGDFCSRLNGMKTAELESAQRQSTIGRFFGAPVVQRTLFVVGTYTIGKERLAVELAVRLGTKLYADTTKRRILNTFNDPVISGLLTSDPLVAQVHLMPIGKTRKELLFEYQKSYKPHFSKVVAFAPTGWSYRPPRSAIQANEEATDLRPNHFEFGDLEYSVNNLDRNHEKTALEPVQKYNVPYSEHSSFVELRAFCLNIAATKIIPTVNMSNEESVRKQMYWLDMWTEQARR